MRIQWTKWGTRDGKACADVHVTEIVDATAVKDGLMCRVTYTEVIEGVDRLVRLLFPMTKLEAESKVDTLLEYGKLDLSRRDVVEEYSPKYSVG